MKPNWYTFYFTGGPIIVAASTETNAKILAQAEAIKRGWNPTCIQKPKLEKLDLIINWDNLTDEEQVQLHSLLCKANYSNIKKEGK